MVLIEIVLIAVGLSADAFSVSLGNGMCMPKASGRKALAVAAAFGGFQAAMPLAGYFASRSFTVYIEAYDHIVALALLAFIGGRMVIGGIKAARNKESVSDERDLGAGALLIQAVATSIDALIVGVGFAAVGLPVAELAKAVILIGSITFVLSFAGVQAGKRFGALLGSRAEIIGGLILIAIGVKLFAEHAML
ncbi:MAG: manganese efflux pump MntP family protein [Clostridiales Family XIII bacterium]|jgi:putative Mn2+ efflux pump MntP|nr:manganese efflux pump MntP family protein [Clostridiales Family XIII bacterium]